MEGMTKVIDTNMPCAVFLNGWGYPVFYFYHHVWGVILRRIPDNGGGNHEAFRNIPVPNDLWWQSAGSY